MLFSPPPPRALTAPPSASRRCQAPPRDADTRDASRLMMFVLKHNACAAFRAIARSNRRRFRRYLMIILHAARRLSPFKCAYHTYLHGQLFAAFANAMHNEFIDDGWLFLRAQLMSAALSPVNARAPRERPDISAAAAEVFVCST